MSARLRLRVSVVVEADSDGYHASNSTFIGSPWHRVDRPGTRVPR